MTLEIKKCTVSEIEDSPNFKALIDEYAVESAIDGLPPPAVRMELYRQLSKAGVLCVWGAFLGIELIGFITVLATVIPHYGVSVVVSESYFVTKKHRDTGAGIKLRHAAEAHTAAIGSPGLLISAPLGSNLAEVLPHSGYTETNRVFFRKTRNE